MRKSKQDKHAAKSAKAEAKAAKKAAKKPSRVSRISAKARALRSALKNEEAVHTQAGAISGSGELLASPIVAASSSIKHGVGEAVAASDGKSSLHQVHRLRKLMFILIGIVLLATVGYFANEYRLYRELRTPERQAALFKEYDTAADQLRDLRSYDQEVASRQAYLAMKPDAQYRDRATLKLADALVGARRYDEAISQYRLVENLPEHQIEAWRGLSGAYAAKGDASRAVEYSQKVIDTLKAQSGKNPDAGLRAAIEQVRLDALKQR